ncbi:MAG: recombinase family protein [Hyphomicrobiaceae bacterium]
MAQRTEKAFAYLRTSSAPNVGGDRDSDRRQRDAIAAFTKRGGYELAGEFYDAAVSGADPIESRPGFAEMLKAIAGNGVRTIIVETANRFARDLMVQEVGFAKLRELGIELVAADSPNAFLDDGPTSKLIRQVLGAVAEFDKAMTVAKLRGARERKRRELGKCEGRKSHVELRPEVVREAKRLRRASPLNGDRRSFRKISSELAAMGHLTRRGTPFSASAVQAMIDGPMPAKSSTGSA